MKDNGNVLMWTIAAASLGILSGCASYAVPGRAVDLKAFGAVREAQTDTEISQTLAKRPLATASVH